MIATHIETASKSPFVMVVNYLLNKTKKKQKLTKERKTKSPPEKENTLLHSGSHPRSKSATTCKGDGGTFADVSPLQRHHTLFTRTIIPSPYFMSTFLNTVYHTT